MTRIGRAGLLGRRCACCPCVWPLGILFGLQMATPVGYDIDLIEISLRLAVRFMQQTYNNRSLPEDSGLTRYFA